MNFNDFSGIGKVLIFIGIGIVVLGLLIFVASKLPFFGKLPGDISLKKENFSFYFPVSTSILISIVLTIIVNAILFIVLRFLK